MSSLIEVRTTAVFRAWRASLRDRAARQRILARLLRVERGLVGDVKPVGGGVSEMRIESGPGYRLYFVRRERQLIVLLSRGDKSSQRDDIKHARALALDPEATDGA